MWPFKRKELFFWDDRYLPLAVYNSEVERGIVHTDEWKQKMSKLQSEYDRAYKEKMLTF